MSLFTVLNALHFKKYLSSSQIQVLIGTQWMARPYWWFKNQDATSVNMLGVHVVGGLFLVCF